jgi:hypothetical protein
MPRTRKKAAAPAEAPVPAATEAPGRSPLAAATGTDDRRLQTALLNDAIAALGIPAESEAHAARGGAVIALMTAMSPRDALEGLLAAQVAALHAAGMAALRCAVGPSLPLEIGSRLRRDAAAMFKTLNETVEVLEARRGSGARQRIVVEHVDKAIFTGPQGGGS